MPPHRYSPPAIVFIVRFPELDDLQLGPFDTADQADAWAKKSIYVVQQKRTKYDIMGVVRPRPDHTA